MKWRQPSQQLKQLIKEQPDKNSGLCGIRTYDLCDTGAALQPTELSSQLSIGYLRIRNI